MPLTPEAKAVVDAFGTQTGVTAPQLANLRATLNGSPALIDEINTAVKDGHLKHIVPLTNPHAGGEYDPVTQSMRLPLKMLNSPASGSYNTGEATFILGHELQHGLNRTTTGRAVTDFGNELIAIARSPQHDHDYTVPIGKFIANYRRDEAGAEISGWNAVVGAVSQEAAAHGKAATIEDVYKKNPGHMSNFVDVDNSSFPPKYTLKPNLEVKPDLSMEASAKNLEGMGKNYFDKPRGAPTGLGPSGNSDYPNYYGAVAIGKAVKFERFYNPATPGKTAPEFSINMASLHLSARQVAENGLNLGASKDVMPYLDKSTTPATPANFRDSSVTHTYSPITPLVPHTPSLDQSTHPDNALYRQTLDAVHKVDAQHHRTPDQSSDNLAAALVVAARRDGLSQVNHVVLSDDKSQAFAVQGDLNSPFKQMAQVQTAQAVQASVAQSSQAWQQATQEKPQAAQAMPLQQDPSQAQPAPTVR
ncbi:XVIPCD domain-containing protein [Dyella silvatica]|uniref:XVIPCD domain-containing protein n=1 Tax=Dyella silvatica TaxID=2992128 RepID=UPI002250E79E|nr:XVIPCD domain-containing protein [Dyella silvatica]